MSKVTFHGLPAWIGAIHGPTGCDWWSSDPSNLSWDRSLLYSVDLANTPSAVQAGYISVADIEVDDHVSNGGRTTIGPMWPGGTSIGAIWVSDGYLAKLGGRAPALQVGAKGHDYEYTTVRYFDGEHGDRQFHGFHANLVQTHNHLSLLEIWHPGTGAAGTSPAGRWWLDLDAHGDPDAPALTPNQPGAVHLDTTATKTLPLHAGKLPPFKGSFALPR
jgi:hypothetical protein